MVGEGTYIFRVSHGKSGRFSGLGLPCAHYSAQGKFYCFQKFLGMHLVSYILQINRKIYQILTCCIWIVEKPGHKKIQTT